ncbi:MAG TPA: SH3 domain-containing protein [Verrucomicrobiae bacterium]|nr:SH3 domain-containing protein [Verrucomicrobiae bacterium]
MRPRGRPFALALTVLAACGWLAGCGATPTPAPTPTPRPSATPTPPATPTPTLPPRVITVLSPDGVNLRAQPDLTGRVLGIVAQGVQLAFLGETATGGGWYHVQGATKVGWVSAIPTLTAPGTFASYLSAALDFGVLYPSGWTFAETPPSVTFAPSGAGPSSPAGPELIVTAAGSLAALPTGAPRGRAVSATLAVQVGGVTTNQQSYAQPAGRSWSTIRLLAHPGLAFLIVARGPVAPTAAALRLLTLTFRFSPSARFR